MLPGSLPGSEVCFAYVVVHSMMPFHAGFPNNIILHNIQIVVELTFAEFCLLVDFDKKSLILL